MSRVIICQSGQEDRNSSTGRYLSLPLPVRYILVGICYFVYFFPFRAWGADPRYLLLLAGLFLALWKWRMRVRLLVPRFYVKVLALPAAVGAWAVISLLYNGGGDLTFVIYPLQCVYLLMLACSVYLVQELCLGHPDIRMCIDIYIGILVVQSVVAVFAFVDPSFASMIYAMQGMDLQSSVMKAYLGMRLIGIGCLFFGAGCLYGLGLILLMARFLLMPKSRGWRPTLFFSVIYIYILIVGMAFARTTMIGFVMSVMLAFCYFMRYPSNRAAIANFRRYLLIFGVIILCVVSAYLSSKRLQDEYGKIVEFAFEMVYSYFEGDGLSTESSEDLKTLYVWPDNLKTYLIGDGKFWADAEKQSYYMFTDVGYLRLIYYFGVPGMLLFMSYTGVIARMCSRYSGSKTMYLSFLVVFLYSLLLNLKGFIDMSTTMYIFLIVLRHCRNNRRKTGESMNRCPARRHF